ncbi:MAG TPA: ABC transporter permease [Bdellovibrio sp.]|nr:ABC transporter permease [Bdellovibrio sp.]
MKAKRIKAIAKKEVFHILRDPFTLALALLLPMFMVVLFGYAMEFNIKDVSLAVFDGDKSSSSRQFVDTLKGSGYFKVNYVRSQQLAIKRIDGDRAKGAVIIESGFEMDLLSNRGAKIQVLLDGSDGSAAGTVSGYLEGMNKTIERKLLRYRENSPVQFVTRYLYNPELNSRWFSTPGLIGMVLGLMSILLTSLTIAREWENGSMELLLSTPASSIEIIIGKLIPYIALGSISVSIVYLVARLFMGVPFTGSHVAFILACVIFLISYLALGIVISVVTRKQSVAMMFALIIGLMPAMLLSGFIFPIESMPKFFQYLTAVLPVRWFIEIARDCFLKGSDFTFLARPLFALSLISLVFVLVARFKFKSDVEP